MSAFEDLSLLRAFVRVVEAGSITAAARTLRLTQPTLSRQLQTLEERSGTQLLFRDTHRQKLTPAGHQMLADARLLLAMAEEAGQRLKGDQVAVRGHIRLFSTIDFGQTVVSRMIASFIQSNAGVTVELAYSNRPLQMIEEGCDLGVIAGDITDDTVVARSLGPIRRYLVGAPELVRSRGAVRRPSDLQDWPWLNLAGTQFEGGNKVHLLHRRSPEVELQIAPLMMAEGVTSLREAVRMQLGIAVLPEWLITEDLVSGRLVRVLPEWSARNLPAHVVHPVQRRMPERVRRLADFATDYMSSVLRVGVTGGQH